MINLYGLNIESLKIGPLELSTYGIIISLCIGILYIIVGRKLRQLKFKDSNIDILLIFAVVFGVVLGRVAYVLLHIEEYYFFADSFRIWEGGIHLFGVLTGAMAGLFVASRIIKKNFWQITDTVAVYTPLVQAIGRLGNFVNHELLGTPTDLPWGMFVTPKHRPLGYIQFHTFHPIFAYEAILNLLNFGILIWISKKDLKPGTLTAVYFFNYALIRFFMEFLRLDTSEVFIGLKLTQIICLIVLSFAGVWLYKTTKSLK